MFTISSLNGQLPKTELKTNQRRYKNLPNSAFSGWLSTRNPEFRNNPENFNPWICDQDNAQYMEINLRGHKLKFSDFPPLFFPRLSAPVFSPDFLPLFFPRLSAPVFSPDFLPLFVSQTFCPCFFPRLSAPVFFPDFLPMFFPQTFCSLFFSPTNRTDPDEISLPTRILLKVKDPYPAIFFL